MSTTFTLSPDASQWFVIGQCVRMNRLKKAEAEMFGRDADPWDDLPLTGRHSCTVSGVATAPATIPAISCVDAFEGLQAQGITHLYTMWTEGGLVSRALVDGKPVVPVWTEQIDAYHAMHAQKDAGHVGGLVVRRQLLYQAIESIAELAFEGRCVGFWVRRQGCTDAMPCAGDVVILQGGGK